MAEDPHSGATTAAGAAQLSSVGLGVRSAANDLNLGFMQATISKLGGYDLEPAGTVEPLSDNSAKP